MRLPDRALESSRRWLVGLGVVVLFLSLFGNIYQGRMNGQQSADYHASSLHQQREIEGLLKTVITVENDKNATLKEVQSLQKQVASVILALPAADMYLGKLAVGLENQIQSLCNRVGATCSDLPVSLPAPSPTASATATTTTTSRPGALTPAPVRGKGRGHR